MRNVKSPVLQWNKAWFVQFIHLFGIPLSHNDQSDNSNNLTYRLNQNNLVSFVGLIYRTREIGRHGNITIYLKQYAHVHAKVVVMVLFVCHLLRFDTDWFYPYLSVLFHYLSETIVYGWTDYLRIHGLIINGIYADNWYKQSYVCMYFQLRKCIIKIDIPSYL